MGKSDEVADMSLEMCNDNGGQPYIYIVRNGKNITGGKNWREKPAGKTGGKKWREKPDPLPADSADICPFYPGWTKRFEMSRLGDSQCKVVCYFPFNYVT